MKHTLTPIVLALTLAACGKAKETASEKIAEKIIESSISEKTWLPSDESMSMNCRPSAIGLSLSR